jgi:hypothetical protein
MVAYSFKAMFSDPILIGRKRHTIRGRRKRHARPGEALQLYTGMRTKSCRLIARAVCSAVCAIDIHFGELRGDYVVIDGKRLDGAALDELAYSDGFDDWDGLRAFWLKNHGSLDAFEGVIIYWGDLVAGAP